MENSLLGDKLKFEIPNGEIFCVDTDGCPAETMVDKYEDEYFKDYKDLLKVNFYRVMLTIVNWALHMALATAITRLFKEQPSLLRVNGFGIFIAAFDQSAAIAFFVRASRPKASKILALLAALFLSGAVAVILI